MGFMDLHVHSTCSDGILSPAQIITAASEAGLSTIALCDHDTVAGVADAQHAGERDKIAVIAGVELSVAFHQHQDVHLLGYGIDTQAPQLLGQLEMFARRRAGRNREIVAKVNERLTAQGKLTLESNEIESLAGGVIGRPHIGRALMARGYVSDMQQAFDQYLVPCNIPKYYWPVEQAVQTIHLVGGIAVLAHPTSITRDQRILTEMIAELQTLGLDGLEVYNNLATEADMLFLERLARQLGLLVTAGSDFHGTNEGEQIGKGRGGIRFSDALLSPLVARISQKAVNR